MDSRNIGGNWMSKATVEHHAMMAAIPFPDERNLQWESPGGGGRHGLEPPRL